MAAYLVVDIEITDPDVYADYIERVPRVVYQYGGRYVARGNDVVPLAGGWTPDRVILIEFPDLEHLTQFGRSSEYRALAPLRERSTRTRSIAVPGLDAQPVPSA